MPIESKIPSEEISIKDLTFEQVEKEQTEILRLRKLGDREFFQAAERRINTYAESEIHIAIEKAALLKLAFPDYNQTFNPDDEQIRNAIKAEKKAGMGNHYLYVLANLKILFPSKPELWSPKSKDIPLFKTEIQRRAKLMETDLSEIMVLAHSGVAYKILQPQDSAFIQEVFTKPAVKKAIHEQLGVITSIKDFGKLQWWSIVGQISPYTIVNPKDAAGILKNAKVNFPDLEDWLKKEKLQHPDYLSQAVIMVSDGLESTDSGIKVKTLDSFNDKDQPPIPEVKKF